MTYNEITVVITSFKSDNKILDCLNSINREIKIIIIENSNNNQFKEVIERKYPNCTCYLSGENLGYGKGNNLGLSKVKSKYALIINPDAILESDAIKNFIVTANDKPNFGIIGPYVQEEKEKKTINILENKLIEVNNVKGFAMFLNMKQFNNIGFFDENIFIYFEEIDLCKRLRLDNKKIYLDTSIKIFHPGGSSHDKHVDYEMELSRNWHWMWSTFYYHKKYEGYLVAFIKVLPKLISSLLKTIFYFIIFNKNKRLIYYQRLSGLFNSILCKKSWYRPKVN